MKSITHNIDCLEFMRTLPDKYFDLAIVDPPYGINAPNMQMGAGSKNNVNETAATRLKKGRLNSGSGKLKDRFLNNSRIDWDNEKPADEYFSELFRVSHNQIIWGGNYFPLPPTRCIYVWDKMQCWENFSQVEIAWTSFDKPAALFQIRVTGCDVRKHLKKIHPTQKPIELYRDLLRRYAKPGDTIFDSHMGSQSSRIACFMDGFDFEGCELDREYFEQGNKRFEEFKKVYGTADISEITPGIQSRLF